MRVELITSDSIFSSVRHIEFFHKEHFLNDYFRVKPRPSLARFIDFFWETDFNLLYQKYPEGFQDVMLPNIGYTYLINLGTPFRMSLNSVDYPMKTDGFLPRHLPMTCYHSKGNKIFGIKFRVSPILFEKKIDFSEYNKYIYPLSYLIEREIVQQIKSARSFNDRVELVSSHYERLINLKEDLLMPVEVVTEVLQRLEDENLFSTPVEHIAADLGISSKSLQRYFMITMGTESGEDFHHAGIQPLLVVIQ